MGAPHIPLFPPTVGADPVVSVEDLVGKLTYSYAGQNPIRQLAQATEIGESRPLTQPGQSWQEQLRLHRLNRQVGANPFLHAGRAEHAATGLGEQFAYVIVHEMGEPQGAVAACIDHQVETLLPGARHRV